MKITGLRVHQSIKVGISEHAFLKEDRFDMELSPSTGLIRITEKRTGAVAYTSLHNTPWFTAEEREVEQKSSPKDSTRASKSKK